MSLPVVAAIVLAFASLTVLLVVLLLCNQRPAPTPDTERGFICDGCGQQRAAVHAAWGQNEELLCPDCARVVRQLVQSPYQERALS